MCKDIYADRMSETFFQNEFSTGDWICPDVANITIFNNPFLFETGRNFVMVINDCPTAVAKDAESGLTSYTDAECAGNAKILTQIDDVRVSYKIMGQNFNPKIYSEQGQMETVMRRRFTTDLLRTQTQSMKFSVVENFIRVFDSWFVDLRDFQFFIRKYIDNAEKTNIQQYSF